MILHKKIIFLPILGVGTCRVHPPPLDLPLYTSVISRAFNIFQVCQYFTIYRQYFLLKFEKNVHEYLIQHSLKSEGTKDHFRRVNVPGTTPVLKGLHYGNH
jgi:hypothetical protein